VVPDHDPVGADPDVALRSAELAGLPTAQQGSAQTHLATMQTVVADLPATAETRAEDSLGEKTGQLTAAEGAALQALRAIIFEHDQVRAFGGLHRVQAPAGDLLWVCENHYPTTTPACP